MPRAVLKIPTNGRKIAYGDAEFEIRHMGDYVSKIEVADLERALAWQLALLSDPQATAPIPDEVMRTLEIPGYGSFPLYPVLDWYDERHLPASELNEGTIKGGIAMTFRYGSTEMQPVGGYGNLPGGMYLVLEAQKAVAEAGHICQFSIDWGEPNAT
jgi:hypothetical protein